MCYANLQLVIEHSFSQLPCEVISMCSCIVTETSESQDTKPSSDGVKMIEKSEHVCLLWLLMCICAIKHCGMTGWAFGGVFVSSVMYIVC